MPPNRDLKPRRSAASDPPPCEPTHIARILADSPLLAAARSDEPPAGFQILESFPGAGLRVNRSLDHSIVAIQFDEGREASRDGLCSEVETLRDQGFRKEATRGQWEREDSEQPMANALGAKRLGATLAEARSAERGR